MNEKKVTRRDFIFNSAAAASVVTLSMAAACKDEKAAAPKEAPKKEEPKKAEAPKAAEKAPEKAAEPAKVAEAPAAGGDGACNDLTGLSDADKAVRKSLGYVDVSADAAKNCANCALFKAGSPCGTCTAVKGPIAAKGYCTAWAPKPA